MTSLMGLPQSIQDNQIHHELPQSGPPYDMAALSLQIQMCHIIAEVNSSEYHPPQALFSLLLLTGCF